MLYVGVIMKFTNEWRRGGPTLFDRCQQVPRAEKLAAMAAERRVAQQPELKRSDDETDRDLAASTA
ncbi:hypothetical protein A2671_02635 [Candidatus Kaiserbacteria bacterium RIFCSPHIGHO2_01_FULL_49_13]|uniref:Uncharacterized protein n=1 Tax=Candidatus Kaiserbacteria bacterium RIFCSPHIGHO2_01_FULL_49_13 TaxID=1798477 RepID=A0A1F6CDC6_9BACT|nr:MAG: hypothetical protein A2671_02635 [Candidatus Kaiserbacteria bacterium RIFCSPHIGHO2_01_FULL_49_13]